METENIEKNQTKTQISDREFVKAWQLGKSPDVVAEALGLQRPSVMQRACTLRKKGVRLKKFPRPAFGREARTPEYYADLLKLAEENGPLSDPIVAKTDSDEPEN